MNVLAGMQRALSAPIMTPAQAAACVAAYSKIQHGMTHGSTEHMGTKQPSTIQEDMGMCVETGSPPPRLQLLRTGTNVLGKGHTCSISAMSGLSRPPASVKNLRPLLQVKKEASQVALS